MSRVSSSSGTRELEIRPGDFYDTVRLIVHTRSGITTRDRLSFTPVQAREAARVLVDAADAVDRRVHEREIRSAQLANERAASGKWSRAAHAPPGFYIDPDGFLRAQPARP